MADSKSSSGDEKLIRGMLLVFSITTFFLGMFYGQLRALNGGAVLGSDANNQPAAQAGTPNQPAAPGNEAPVALTDSQFERLLEDPAAVKGDPDAPVTIVEFTDYQCTFCKRHFDETDPQIQADYVDTGQVRYVIRDLPLSFHANAAKAAEAARCAGDQDQYWEMHDALFANQDAWANLSDPTSAFSGYAQELGLNTGNFDNCLNSGTHAQAVQDDLALAQELGASGTPTFFINGNQLVGAQPLASFQAVIDSEL